MRPINLYNTLTRTVEALEPMDGQCLGFYCCGPTVYGRAHVGNFRTFVMQDVFRRVIEAAGMETQHVRNVTNVDDKTIRDSQSAGKTLADFTALWRDRFHEDCEALGLLKPHAEPSAAAHVPQQIKLVERLLETGHAYKGEDGSLYFRISSFNDYGKLSRPQKRKLVAGAGGRITLDDEYSKENLSDFDSFVELQILRQADGRCWRENEKRGDKK